MTRWNIDAAHSDVQFKVKHLMINTVTGSFQDFSGTVESNGQDFADAKVTFTAQVASVQTRNEMRDNHLRSNDFFNAEQYPEMTFRSTSMVKTGADTYAMTGDLTIREHTHPVTLDVEFGGTIVDPYGNTKAGFEATGKLNRKEFGLTWNGLTEAGGVVVSDEVRLILNIQLLQTADTTVSQPAELEVEA
ncbi:MAG: YceI family protein [Bradyrhizobiaceae bacterium]|nr:YceI family protein [Bradyrhizobiaceae bacterium]